MLSTYIVQWLEIYLLINHVSFISYLRFTIRCNQVLALLKRLNTLEVQFDSLMFVFRIDVVVL